MSSPSFIGRNNIHMYRITNHQNSTTAPRTGSIAWCNVMNPHENPNSTGKIRPVLLVSRVGGHWLGMGLTTKPAYRNGKPRMAVPNPRSMGLHKPGFLWGRRLTRISAIDVHDVIGTCNPDLAEAVIGLANLYGPLAENLRHEACLATA